jgi:hypothetical protein
MKTALLEILGTWVPPVVLTALPLHSPLIHGAQKSTIQTASSSSLRKNPRGGPPTNLARPHHPHSGSAFPATLAFQIRDLERETSRALSLDAIVTVIDAENFTGYEDTSVTARMQAQYTDVLLIVRLSLSLPSLPPPHSLIPTPTPSRARSE